MSRVGDLLTVRPALSEEDDALAPYIPKLGQDLHNSWGRGNVRAAARQIQAGRAGQTSSTEVGAFEQEHHRPRQTLGVTCLDLRIRKQKMLRFSETDVKPHNPLVNSFRVDISDPQERWHVPPAEKSVPLLMPWGTTATSRRFTDSTRLAGDFGRGDRVKQMDWISFSQRNHRSSMRGQAFETEYVGARVDVGPDGTVYTAGETQRPLNSTIAALARSRRAGGGALAPATQERGDARESVAFESDAGLGRASQRSPSFQRTVMSPHSPVVSQARSGSPGWRGGSPEGRRSLHSSRSTVLQPAASFGLRGEEPMGVRKRGVYSPNMGNGASVPKALWVDRMRTAGGSRLVNPPPPSLIPWKNDYH